ncbi:MAG: hypothetical protein M0036_08370 [Desulfobacteraceae bacterium]|nr:hypothetical protein [Desulfobacteraceae bacterium]
MDPTTVILAIECGVRLGRKLNDVLVDQTQERALILPLGNLYAQVAENDAIDYFRDHPELTAPGAPYAGLSKSDQVKAYRTLLALGERLGDTHGLAGEARRIVQQLQKFDQLKKGYGARPALQRILGEVVEIAIDYFAARPEMLSGDTTTRKILSAWLSRLDDIEFAESTPDTIVMAILYASFKTLEDQILLVDDDSRLQALLGGVTQALVDGHRLLTSQGEQVRREALIQRIASGLLRAGAEIFSKNNILPGGASGTTQKWVAVTLSQIVDGIQGKEHLFTSESLELIYKSILSAAAKHPQLFSAQPVIQDFIEKTLNLLMGEPEQSVFANEMVASVLQYALDMWIQTAGVELMADPPADRRLLAALRILNQVLAMDGGHGRPIKDLFDREQMVALTKIVLESVANHSYLVTMPAGAGDRDSALAQIIGAVSFPMAQAPDHLRTKQTLLTILQMAMTIAGHNSDRLVASGGSGPAKSILFRTIQQVVTAVSAGEDQRGLVQREEFLEIVRRILPVVSANIQPLMKDNSRQVEQTIRQALVLSTSALSFQINGANLPRLIEQLLVQILWEELDLGDDKAVEGTARLILRKMLEKE